MSGPLPKASSRPRKKFSAAVKRADQRKILIDGLDAEALRLGPGATAIWDWPSSEILARGRIEGAREDLDQRRLAGTVVADETDDVAAGEVERDAIERPGCRRRILEMPRRLSKGSGSRRSLT